MIYEINGQLLKNMIISGANNLNTNKQIVDDLNVFPVPDGDTGTNMSLTILAVRKELLETEDEKLSSIAKLAASTCAGTRSNSVISLL